MNRKIDEPTSPSLLLRLRDHADDESWQAFVDVYSPLIYEFCRMRGMQASDAADVTQESLLRVARVIRGFEYDPSKGLFRDWLARIVVNEIRRNASRAARAPQLTADLNQDPGIVDGQWQEYFQQHIFEIALQRAKPHFEDLAWTLFQRSWLEKVKPEIVANECGVKIEQVYVARSRVLKRLRYELGILCDDMV